MQMTLWILIGLMCLVAVGFAIWPLYRQQKGLTPLIGVAVLFVVALSSGLYYYQGKPDQMSASGSAGAPGVDEVVTALAERLASKPNDVKGWKMLGRSYMATGNYAGAVEAFEKAMELESAQDASTLVSLGEALLANTGSSIDGHIASLFENALALESNNPQALFYGGIGAFNRNEIELAADRWERLLALNPPAEIQGILQQRIAEWRGETPPAMAEISPATESATPAPIDRPGVVVSAELSLSTAAAAAVPAEATVFIIARDPAQPVPPIAVARRRLSELPATVGLGDRESMVPGRSLSGFTEFELIARVSVSGQPNAQSGDWFGSQIVKPAENSNIELSIAEQVP